MKLLVEIRSIEEFGQNQQVRLQNEKISISTSSTNCLKRLFDVISSASLRCSLAKGRVADAGFGVRMAVTCSKEAILEEGGQTQCLSVWIVFMKSYRLTGQEKSLSEV